MDQDKINEFIAFQADKKKSLTKEINALITKFYNETGLHVREIGIDGTCRKNSEGERFYFFNSVNLEVDFI